jgi:sec-independent protein translocase protein TatC
MPLLAHLEELRRRLIKILLAIGVGCGGSYAFSDHILNWLTQPLPQRLVFISPTEAFLVSLKIAFFTGVVVTLPFSLFQIWKFVAPALSQAEKGYAFSFITFGSLLFLAGILFAYYVILPLGLQFLLSYGSPGLQPMISVGQYISFCITILFAFGLVFNLPLMVMLLARMKLLDSRLLAKNRRYALLIISVIAALLTPPDVFTQILLAFPLLLLYELSIWLSRIAGK